MIFEDFCRAHGLLIKGALEIGCWIRCPTVDKPRSDNGAYKFMGDVGWAQNWATMTEPDTWRPERRQDVVVDTAAVQRAVERQRQKVREGWAKAARRAHELVKACTAAGGRETHSYLQLKGLPDERGLVAEDGSLIVPMRHWRTNSLVGAQVITWHPEERVHGKKMLPGMRARGAVFRIGSAQAARSWLVEGYATGLSVAQALRLMRSRDSVLVCFSAGNLVTVAGELGGNLVAFADNDQSGAGQRAAETACVPYVMSPVVGEDANDMHARVGVFALAAHMRKVSPVERAPAAESG